MIILAIALGLASAPTNAAVSAQELAFTCGYQGDETDIAAITSNRNRCQNYLSGVIDVFRWKYSDLGVRCLPEPFTLAILSADVVEAGRSFSSRSEEHTSELQALKRISYATFCLKKKKIQRINNDSGRSLNGRTKDIMRSQSHRPQYINTTVPQTRRRCTTDTSISSLKITKLIINSLSHAKAQSKLVETQQ